MNQDLGNLLSFIGFALLYFISLFSNIQFKALF